MRKDLSPFNKKFRRCFNFLTGLDSKNSDFRNAIPFPELGMMDSISTVCDPERLNMGPPVQRSRSNENKNELTTVFIACATSLPAEIFEWRISFFCGKILERAEDGSNASVVEIGTANLDSLLKQYPEFQKSDVVPNAP